VTRNIDIVAIALLLLAIALYTHLRHFVILQLDENGVRLRPDMNRIIIPPPPPVPPHVWTMRD
jgi:hypothetical protein